MHSYLQQSAKPHFRVYVEDKELSNSPVGGIVVVDTRKCQFMALWQCQFSSFCVSINKYAQ